MKIYIAGKIAGDPGYREKFNAAAKALAGEGHTVLNPATLPDGLSRAEYMQICFQMIFAADKVVFLEDFTESKGAMLEYSLCRHIGKTMDFPYETYETLVKKENTMTWLKEN